MAYSFKLIAKRDIRPSQGGPIVLGKGMSFEFAQSSASIDTGGVKKAIKERYGVNVTLNTVAIDFEVIKLF